MVIHETSQNLPKSSGYWLIVSLLSLSYFAYLSDKLVELGLVIFTALAIKQVSKRFENCAFTPKSIHIDSASNTFKYYQDSTVYFRVPLDEITQVRIQQESLYGNNLMIYTSNDSYQVPNSDNFDAHQLAQLMQKLQEKIDD